VRVQGRRLVYELGKWEVDLARRELRARGVPVPIGGRAFENIELFFWSARELVTRGARLAYGSARLRRTTRSSVAYRRSARTRLRSRNTKDGTRSWLSPTRCVDVPAGTSSVDPIDLEPLPSPAEPFRSCSAHQKPASYSDAAAWRNRRIHVHVTSDQ
jgi:hypothetical protein